MEAFIATISWSDLRSVMHQANLLRNSAYIRPVSEKIIGN